MGQKAKESYLQRSAAQPMTTKSRSLPRFFWRSSMTLGAPPASAPRRRSANHSLLGLLDNAPPYCTSAPLHHYQKK